MQRQEQSTLTFAAHAAIVESHLDTVLQTAAVRALGDQEGVVLAMDPHTGRIRAVVNPRLAFEQSFPPGSAIKPFSALAAMRAGTLTPDSRLECRGTYTNDNFSIVCSHPKCSASLTLAQALAYSCNYYFASLSDRLDGNAFHATLASFGFGERPGVQSIESAGSLPFEDWDVREALGESPALRVTPVQLLTAYVALCNGGHLFKPILHCGGQTAPEERRRISLSRTQCNVLVEGMRGAVRYGTAAGEGYDALPISVFGKTGTSSASNGFRTQGWFVGFAEAPASKFRRTVPDVDLAVLVFLKRAHGSQCAALARVVFEAYANASTEAATLSEIRCDSAQSNTQTLHEQNVRVHLVSTGETIDLSLEHYLRGVLAAEAGSERQVEALKAQAVLSRTFAMKNRGRHANEGYDFCSTTHCQRFIHPSEQGLIADAVNETKGEVLLDRNGKLADIYFHASCGGKTADAGALWGGASPEYLHGVDDPYCETMPHHEWTATITKRNLLAALHSDPASDVGGTISNVIVKRRDGSGRAQSILLRGIRCRCVRGWDFKLIVGRSLGWNMLKSSRFRVERCGANFVFHGSGFGHGVGCCQEGAHVMAEQGNNCREIVAHYFPGTHIATRAKMQPMNKQLHAIAAPVQFAQTLHSSKQGSQTLSSDHFQITAPVSVDYSECEAMLRVLESARTEIQRKLNAASIPFPAETSINVVFHATTQGFMRATGLQYWAAAMTHGHRIDLQPMRTLNRRGVLGATLRHEYAHWIIEAMHHGNVPRWLVEGMAEYAAGEGRMLSSSVRSKHIDPDELERRFDAVDSPTRMRSLYSDALIATRELIDTEGERAVWQRLAR